MAISYQLSAISFELLFVAGSITGRFENFRRTGVNLIAHGYCKRANEVLSNGNLHMVTIEIDQERNRLCLANQLISPVSCKQGIPDKIILKNSLETLNLFPPISV